MLSRTHSPPHPDGPPTPTGSHLPATAGPCAYVHVDLTLSCAVTARHTACCRGGGDPLKGTQNAWRIVTGHKLGSQISLALNSSLTPL